VAAEFAPTLLEMEAEFYLALGFAGCELGVSKISDRTRPFI
jgi:hypothetical protein